MSDFFEIQTNANLINFRIRFFALSLLRKIRNKCYSCFKKKQVSQRETHGLSYQTKSND